MVTQEIFASMCAHMNDDHAEAVGSYASVYANVEDVRSAVMTAMDARGMDLRVETPSGTRDVRIDFDHTIADAEDAKQTLIRLAVEARPQPVVENGAGHSTLP